MTSRSRRLRAQNEKIELETKNPPLAGGGRIERLEQLAATKVFAGQLPLGRIIGRDPGNGKYAFYA